jgi:archaellum component FlaC
MDNSTDHKNTNLTLTDIALEQILKKLDSIDNRLSVIEENIGGVPDTIDDIKTELRRLRGF